MTLSEHFHTASPQDSEETIVIFRVLNEDESVIALFPEQYQPGGMVGSYQKIGQHGAADYQWVVATSRPALDYEYEDLAAELEEVGYRLRILKKKPIRL